jgi:hypothetical protein
LPDWRDEVCSALDFWISKEGGERSTPGMSRIGRARQEGARGWYAVDVRNSRADTDQPEALRLAGPEEPRSGAGYQVLDVVQDGSVIRIRVAEFVDQADAYLWRQRQPPTYLIVKLRDGIAELDDAGLAHDLAHGRLTPVPERPRQVAGFTLGQRQALESCTGRGVHLVWGPPGTGKTRVLTEAMGALVAAGQRVLLVSATNIAVDNALLGVAKARRYTDGALLRVGTPHHPEILAHEDICLPALVRERLTTVELERKTLEQLLVRAREDESQLRQLEERLTEFDPVRYRSLKRRLALRDQLPVLAEQEQRAKATREAAAVEAAQLRDRTIRADGRVREWAAARAAYLRIDALRKELDDARAATDKLVGDALHARGDAERLAAWLRRLDGETLIAKLRNRGTRQRLRRSFSDESQAAANAEARAGQATELLARRVAEVEGEIGQIEATVRASREDLVAADRELVEARRMLAQAEIALRQATEAADAAIRTLSAAEAEARLSGDDLRWLEHVDQLGLPSLAQERDQLRSRVAGQAVQVATWQRQYAKVQEEFDRLRKDAEGEIIRAAQVVATTLARMRTNPTVMAGPYDVVLVDEVGAANVPEVLLAVSRASRAAVLLGDFMQLGAILPPPVRKDPRPDVRRWLVPDVFAHCGIRTSAQARQHPGCTALDVQHRFGPEIMGLANAVAYDGLLRAGQQVRAHTEDDPEIVLINVDDLDDLGVVRPTGPHKGWWPAGALLSRVLADYHQTRGERVGVVTPYGDQVEATLEALRDQEEGSGTVTEVGTAHRFQGREFPVVVFDLVEDDRSERWMSAASLNADDYARSGIRLFNVAITRAQTRLYLIASRRRVDAAKPDSPLACVSQLLRERRARMVSGACLVAPTVLRDKDRFGLGVFGNELADVLAEHVRISDISDERQFYDTFAGHLSTAERSIWLWAPWTTSRVTSLLPVLTDAVARGVAVRLFVRDPSDNLQGRTSSQAYLAQLRTALPTVVEVHEMHQKIVVIDERIVLLGSLNALSQRTTREVMLTLHGEHFARKLLEHEHATVFAAPPRCGACRGTTVQLRRTKQKGWHWRCYAPTCPRWNSKGTRNWTETVVLKPQPARQSLAAPNQKGRGLA